MITRCVKRSRLRLFAHVADVTRPLQQRPVYLSVYRSVGRSVGLLLLALLTTGTCAFDWSKSTPGRSHGFLEAGPSTQVELLDQSLLSDSHVTTSTLCICQWP